MAIQRESILQVRIKRFVRDAIDGAEFFAFDRGKAANRFTHLAQAGRGVRKGTPDTLLRVKGCVPVWVELKTPGNKPDPAQLDVGARLQAVGDVWFWTDTVEGYRQGLLEAGVPMRPNAAFLAMHHDAAVAGVIATTEARKGVPRKAAKPRAAKPTQGAVKRLAALRGKVMV